MSNDCLSLIWALFGNKITPIINQLFIIFVFAIELTRISTSSARWIKGLVHLLLGTLMLQSPVHPRQIHWRFATAWTTLHRSLFILLIRAEPVCLLLRCSPEVVIEVFHLLLEFTAVVLLSTHKLIYLLLRLLVPLLVQIDPSNRIKRYWWRYFFLQEIFISIFSKPRVSQYLLYPMDRP